LAGYQSALNLVIPAEAGIQSFFNRVRKPSWMPVSTGMTVDRRAGNPAWVRTVDRRGQWISREILLKNPKNASTGLSMNANSTTISTAPPFVLRVSKDERKVFQQNQYAPM